MVVDATAGASDPGPTKAEEVSAPDAPAAPALPAARFQGEEYVDAAELQQSLQAQEGKRFFVVPDGSGRKQTIQGAQLGIGLPEEAPMTPDLPIWQSCRVKLPLISLKAAKRYDLTLPATDKDKVSHAGFLLLAPAGARRVTIKAWEQAGRRAAPVLAQADGEGRIVAIVNNMPTQSIPETAFRYASVGGTIPLPASESRPTFYALLDARLLAGKLSSSCGMAVAEEGTGNGLVTLQFSGMSEE